MSSTADFEVDRFIADLWLQDNAPLWEIHTSDPLGLFNDWAHTKWSGTKRVNSVATFGILHKGAVSGAVLFSDWTGPNVLMHVASDGSRRWFNRTFLKLVFNYAFVQLGCLRITAAVAGSNTAASKFVDNLGFKLEHAFAEVLPNDLVCVYSLARTTWRSR